MLGARNPRPRADQLLFVVDREGQTAPLDEHIHFPASLGKRRDRRHASMVRWASQLIWQVAKEAKRVRKKSKLPYLGGM